MESIIQRTEIEVETLNLLPQKFSAFPSYTPRRSHLDSASYRSLVRILSRCLDHSLVPPAPVETTINVINPTSSNKVGELPLDQVAGANINGKNSMERQDEGDRCADGGGHEGSLVTAGELVGIDPTVFDDDFESPVNIELLSRYMSDCERLINVPNAELSSSGELHVEIVQVGHRKIVDKELEIAKTRSHGEAEGVSNLNEISEVAKEDASSERSNGMPSSSSLIGDPISEFCSIGQSIDWTEQSGQKEIVNNDLGISKACVHGAEPHAFNAEEVLNVSKDDANNKLPRRVSPDCDRTTDLPNQELHSSKESHGANREDDHKQIAVNGFKIIKDCFHGAEKGNFIPVEVSPAIEGGANNELLNSFTSDCSKLIDASTKKLYFPFELHDGNGQSVHEDIANTDPKITKTNVLGTQEGFNIMEISEVLKGDANHVLPNEVIFNGRRLIDSPNRELQSSARPHDRNVQAGYKKIVDNDLISKAFFCGTKDGISDPRKVLEVAKEVEMERIQPNVSEGGHDSVKESEGMRKATRDVGDEKIEVTKQTCVNSPSLMDQSDVRNVEEDQVNTLIHQIDGGFEEGEIPDEIQDLEGQIDITDGETVQGPRRIDFNEAASTSAFVHKNGTLELGTGSNPSIIERKGTAIDYEDNLCDTSETDSTDEETQRKQMVMNTREKKQRGPLTEERKAKKKIAKKRKRAQKNREQGVKKLKLHTITKPKEVKICNFYLMGRCQQGDLCKYSHDAPLIKSTPCKYFASNSCLKGDDCMFDHELSKYPCHKYVSTGSCIRGDGCKFSHKISAQIPAVIPATEAITSTKIESHLSSEPPKLRKPPVWAHVSPSDRGPFESNNKGTPSLGHTPLKKATQVPKGIRFLSFGAGQTDLTNQVKGNLSVNKFGKNGAYNQHHSASSLASSGSAASSNGFSLKDSCNITKVSSITTPGTVNPEVSEATKILEEFLFCGANQI